MNFKKFLLGAMVAATLSLLVVGGILFYANRQPQMGGPFQAISANGPWHFNDDIHKVNLLYIGYAKCPDVCPLALSYAHSAFAGLTEKEKQNTRFIFVSVDIKNDTAESVAAYAGQFHPKFTGLTGTQSQIDAIMKLFGASYIVESDPKSYLGYSIAHTDRIFFLNKKGHIVDSVPNPRSAEELIKKIKENL